MTIVSRVGVRDEDHNEPDHTDAGEVADEGKVLPSTGGA